MLRTPKDYKYAASPDSTNAAEYRISPNDIIEFSLYSNDGFKLVDLTSLNTNNSTGFRIANGTEYLVEPTGEVKLPVLGKIKITGLTIREAQSLLEEKYASYYIRPYVMMRVINKRVIVFPGSAGDAKVIPLLNNNTTLIEGIALAGGLADDGKAKMIKLIREKKGEHEVYLI
ncbi:MAG TPA: polysaccharide biosynthesis/export family protein, partial [Bacteroidia bacterium]|nr:polysaccharide biosynthesis/export family protein [Bacteroidia bacterium]